MANWQYSQALRSKTVLILLVMFGFAFLARRSQSQEHVLRQSLESTSPQVKPVLEPSAPVVNLPPELQLAGVWSFVATTYGVQSQDGDNHVQRGHWAIFHDGSAYMAGYRFDKANAFGRRFLVSVSTDHNGGLFVQSIDVEDDYTKRYGICEISKDGSHVKLAFCTPPDGSLGDKPTSFDPKLNPKGFALIELNRLTSAPSDSSVNAGTHRVPSAKAIAGDESGKDGHR